MPLAQKEFRVTHLDQIETLSSPARQEILSSVETYGPCSISEIADNLGRPADSLYYHIRKMTRVGLLVDRGSRRARRRDEHLFDVPGRPMVTCEPQGPAAQDAVLKTTAAMLRLTDRNVQEAFRSGEAVLEGPDQNVAACRAKGWLNPDERREVLDLMKRVHEIVNRGTTNHDGSDLMAVSMVATPVAPVDRAVSENGNGVGEPH